MTIWEGATVVITGGSGSFGNACTRRLLADGVKAIRCYSRDEWKQSEMAKRITDPRIRFILGDVRDRDRLRRAFEGADIVLHAAALKQVPAGERDPLEFKKTNVDGAANVIEAAIDAGVKRVMALSSDKSCAPMNLYGKTKAVAESLFINANTYSGNRVRFGVVRYGNVVGSRGSIVPLLMEQKAKGVVTLTDARCTRFWMTLGEAVRFVLDRTDDIPALYVPKLPSVGLPDLIEAVAPGCRVETIGLRDGEKIAEQMVSADEAPYAYDRGDHYAIHQTVCAIPTLKAAYSSYTNEDFLSVAEIRERLPQAMTEAAM